MQKTTFTLLLSIFAFNLLGQIRFEKGYFIDNNADTIHCQIKNSDWRTNPRSFHYKLDGSETIVEASIAEVQTFCIWGVAKYVRDSVDIDQSSHQTHKLSADKNPVWLKELVFLKVLVEGQASLYSYTNNIKRFLYKHPGDSLVRQLVYKEYVRDDKVLANNAYKHQIWNDVRCEGYDMDKVLALEYKEKDLVKYFKQYNQLGNHGVTLYTQPSCDIYHLKITPGLSISNMVVYNKLSIPDGRDFGSNLGLRLGLESAFILPFHRNKWEILVELNYEYFKSKSSDGEIQIHHIEYPVGLRYNTFFKPDRKLFINGFFVPSSSLNPGSKIDLAQYVNPLDVSAAQSFAMGIGYSHHSFSVEFRYYTRRDMLRGYQFWLTDYQRFSFIMGYRLLRKRTHK